MHAAEAEFKLPTKPLELWSSQELAAWMASLGEAYSEFAVKLHKIGVSGAESVEYFQSEASWTTELGVPAGLQVCILMMLLSVFVLLLLLKACKCVFVIRRAGWRPSLHHWCGGVVAANAAVAIACIDAWWCVCMR